MKPCSFAVTLMMVVTLVAVSSASADDATELAKKLANPISSLISLPIQANYDENFGSDEEGERWLINVQPVIPISLNEDWNIISRTICADYRPKKYAIAGIEQIRPWGYYPEHFLFAQGANVIRLDLGGRPSFVPGHCDE